MGITIQVAMIKITKTDHLEEVDAAVGTKRNRCFLALLESNS